MLDYTVDSVVTNYITKAEEFGRKLLGKFAKYRKIVASLIDTLRTFDALMKESIRQSMLKRIHKNSNYLVSGEILNYAGENCFPSHRRGYVGYWLLEFRI